MAIAAGWLTIVVYLLAAGDWVVVVYSSVDGTGDCAGDGFAVGGADSSAFSGVSGEHGFYKHAGTDFFETAREPECDAWVLSADDLAVLFAVVFADAGDGDFKLEAQAIAGDSVLHGGDCGTAGCD